MYVDLYWRLLSAFLSLWLQTPPWRQVLHENTLLNCLDLAEKTQAEKQYSGLRWVCDQRKWETSLVVKCGMLEWDHLDLHLGPAIFTKTENLAKLFNSIEYLTHCCIMRTKWVNRGKYFQSIRHMETTIKVLAIITIRRWDGGWHHWLNGHEFEQTLGDGDGWGSLACGSPWGHKESDMNEWMNNSNYYRSHVKKMSSSWNFRDKQYFLKQFYDQKPISSLFVSKSALQTTGHGAHPAHYLFLYNQQVRKGFTILNGWKNIKRRSCFMTRDWGGKHETLGETGNSKPNFPPRDLSKFQALLSMPRSWSLS